MSFYTIPIIAVAKVAAPFVNALIKSCIKNCRKEPAQTETTITHVATDMLKQQTTTMCTRKPRLTVQMPLPEQNIDMENAPTPTQENYVSDDERTETDIPKKEERTIRELFNEIAVPTEEFQLPSEFINAQKTKKQHIEKQADRALRSADMILRSKKHVRFNDRLSFQRVPYFAPACRLKTNAR